MKSFILISSLLCVLALPIIAPEESPGRVDVYPREGRSR